VRLKSVEQTEFLRTKTMATRNKSLIRKSLRSILGLTLLGSLAVTGPLLAQIASGPNDPSGAHAHHDHSAPAKLVEIVRNVTQHFIDVNGATAADYQPLFGCVSGPDHGAMGLHYINLSLYGDGEIARSMPPGRKRSSTSPGRMVSAS
jgi:hypothetical protein